MGNVDGTRPRFFTLFYSAGGIKNIELKPGEKTVVYVYEGDRLCIGSEGRPPHLDNCKRFPIPVDVADPSSDSDLPSEN